MPQKKDLLNAEFLNRVREYLPINASIREANVNDQPGRELTGNELVPHTFHHLDSQAVCALTHAIEDLALDEANGQLIAALQEFTNFEGDRERYCQLAATIEGVQVIGAGEMPKRVQHLKFSRDGQSVCVKFWGVVYEGKNKQAALLCRQTNEARVWDERCFIGFYCFAPTLVNRIGKELNGMLEGRVHDSPEFNRLMAIDKASKELDLEFGREKAAAGAALRKLQKGEHYNVNQFAADLEKSLERLHTWKSRVSSALEQSSARND